MPRDRDVRNAIAEVLEETDAFNAVSQKGLPEEYGAAAGDLALAIIEPSTIVTTDLWDGGANTSGVRNCTCTITVLVRDQDPQLRDAKVERLSNIVANTVQGNSFNGFTNPDHSRILGPIRMLPAKHPERRATINFQYEYIWDGWASFDTSD